jgi:hypothetical protein
MTILLQWLVEHAWIFYVVCAVGAVIYMVRALAAQKERSLALFTLERETATAQLVKAWAMVFVFVAVGAVIFASTTFILPSLPIHSQGTPRPTPTLSAGVELPTPGITPTPTLGSLGPTFTPIATNALVPTPLPPEPTEPPTPAPADTPETSAAGEIRVRFGDFAELVGYSLSATETTTAQPLLLTLQWRALEGTSTLNYMVFTHLLSSADGHLIAQHDGAPAGGTRPTTGWVPGETIADEHAMVFYDTAHTGPAKIAVGLYDPAIGRVLTQTGDNYVVLPTTITIVPLTD